jgi:hypothetical protein
MFAGLGDALKKGATDAAASVQARVDTAKEGKNMLDEGGKPVEAKVAAKALAIKAVGVDVRLCGEKIPCAIAEYRNAAEKAKDALSVENASALSAEEKAELQDCVKSFELRAGMLEDMLKQLNQAGTPKEPKQSLAELDAWRLLSAKGVYRDVSGKVTADFEQGMEAAKKRGSTMLPAGDAAPPPVAPAGYPAK